MTVNEPRTRPAFRVLGTIAVIAMYAVIAPLFLQHAHTDPKPYNEYIGLAGGTLACVALVYRVWTIR